MSRLLDSAVRFLESPQYGTPVAFFLLGAATVFSTSKIFFNERAADMNTVNSKNLCEPQEVQINFRENGKTYECQCYEIGH